MLERSRICRSDLPDFGNGPVVKADYWTFIQLDAKYQTKDAFCSCEGEEESEGCVHLAAAYLSIFRKTGSTFAYPF